ncbi:MAG: hypothetical protein HS115_19270 [Spirochaetales bacterium]|nr:hypothetical protein [Spirochaetales bacterium]
MSAHLLSEERITQIWGEGAALFPRATFALRDVPEALLVLKPYASFWGITDDTMRIKILRATPEALKRNLKSVVSHFDNELDAWLAGPQANREDPSDAYVAFSAMRMSADYL